MKKNCENCIHLEWGFGDVNDPEGYICTKSDYDSYDKERGHIKKLERDSYRQHAKKCCELWQDDDSLQRHKVGRQLDKGFSMLSKRKPDKDEDDDRNL